MEYSRLGWISWIRQISFRQHSLRQLSFAEDKHLAILFNYSVNAKKYSDISFFTGGYGYPNMPGGSCSGALVLNSHKN